MIELPEAAAIAKQLGQIIRGKRIASCDTGDSPHKWVAYKPSREELTERLTGKTVGASTYVGRGIQIAMEPDPLLVIDEFGGKIRYHEPDSPPPRKYHLRLQFADDAFFTLAIQGWGFIATQEEWQQIPWVIDRANAISPAAPDFTAARFSELVELYPEKEKDSIKTFFTNGRSVAGIGNGYLQDILFRAGISPKRKVKDITHDEKAALFGAAKETVEQAISLRGRNTESDIYGDPGGYKPLMDRFTVDKPCPSCQTPIEKISYLGGSCYICPQCQK